jgi:hypothetical protein
VVTREIDPTTGYLTTPYCPQTRSEIFVEGTAPERTCPIHSYQSYSERWRSGGEDDGELSDEERRQRRRERNPLRRLFEDLFD